MRQRIWCQERIKGWVEVLLARLSGVSASRQLRCRSMSRQVSLGEPSLTTADAAPLFSVRPSRIYEAARDEVCPWCAPVATCASCARIWRTGAGCGERRDDHDARMFGAQRAPRGVNRDVAAGFPRAVTPSCELRFGTLLARAGAPAWAVVQANAVAKAT